MKSLAVALLLANSSGRKLDQSKSQENSLTQVELGSQSLFSDIFGKDFELFGKKDDDKEKDLKKDKNSDKEKDEDNNKNSEKKGDELPHSEASTIVDVVSENLPETDEEAAAKKDK